MHYLLIFWIAHEGPSLFLLQDAVADDVRTIEALIDMRDPAAQQKAVKNFHGHCYQSKRYVYQPDDALLRGSVRIVNLRA